MVWQHVLSKLRVAVADVSQVTTANDMRLVIVSEAVERGSFANTVAANVTRLAFGGLKAAPIVLGAPNWIAPGADMEDKYAPQAHDICDAVTGGFFADRRINRRGVRDWDIAGMAKRGI